MNYRTIQKELAKHHDDYMAFNEEASLQSVINRVSYMLFDSGMSIREIEKRTGISRSTIGRFTSGEYSLLDAKLNTLLKLDEYASRII